MSDKITVQGVVLQATDVGEYDKRLVLLTRERGKITAFAKGAKRQGSPYMAAANAFVFGTFTLYEGKNSYNVNQVTITHQFMDLTKDPTAVYYGFYFMEIADYFGKEGNDEKEMMNLLFVSLRALLNPKIPNALIRCIYEFRTLVIQGECPEIFACVSCGDHTAEELSFFSFPDHGLLCRTCGTNRTGAFRITGTLLYTLRYIATAPLGKLYTFTLKDDNLRELQYLVHNYLDQNTDKKFRTLSILEVMLGI